MALNYFNAVTTRRLSIGLLSAAGVLFLAALNLIGVGISAGDRTYAEEISESVPWLSGSALAGLLSLIASEFTGHPDAPDEGRPVSWNNHLQCAFAALLVCGLGGLIFGGYKLIAAAIIE